MVEQAGARAAGVVIGLDRKERGKGDQSAIQEVQTQFDIPVVSIIDIGDVVAYLQAQSDSHNMIEKIQQYRQQYGV